MTFWTTGMILDQFITNCAYENNNFLMLESVHTAQTNFCVFYNNFFLRKDIQYEKMQVLPEMFKQCWFNWNNDYISRCTWGQNKIKNENFFHILIFHFSINL